MQLKSAMKTIAWLAPTVLALGLAAVCVSQHSTIAVLRQQLHAQRDQLAELDRLREENKAAQRLQDQQGEIERLRENTRDLMRLRNEVTQLRKQVGEIETLRAANAQLLQAVPGVGALQSNQVALITAARKKGAVLGIFLRPGNDPQAQAARGAEVLGLDPNSPVATSGVLPGDLIVALEGKPILTSGQLQAEMLTRAPGDTVMLDVVRTNTVLRFQVKTRAWPE